jgi:hypothetical protein
MMPIKRTVAAALLAALATAGGLYFAQHHRAQEAAHLRYENNRMRYTAAMRHQTANPVAAGAAAATTPARNPLAGPEAPQTPAGDYRNAGQATPQATFQTFAWACANGDAARVERLLCFEEVARDKAQAFMATLPDAARRNWSTPEAMAAALFIADASEHPFPAAMILAKATPAALAVDRVLLELPGAGPLREHTEYVKQGESWRYVITAAAVDDYIARTGGNRR